MIALGRTQELELLNSENGLQCEVECRSTLVSLLFDHEEEVVDFFVNNLIPNILDPRYKQHQRNKNRALSGLVERLHEH